MIQVSIDRIEGDLAVCITENGGKVCALVSRLPQGAREGSILCRENDTWTLRSEETDRTRQDLFSLQQSLFDE